MRVMDRADINGAVNSGEALLTARQVAARLSVSVAWVLAHSDGSRRPVLPSIKLGRSVRFRPDDLDAFIEKCRRAMNQGLPIQ